LVPGERPILIQDGVVKGVEYRAFAAAAARDGYFALLSHERLAIVTPQAFAMAVHDDRNSVNILDAVQIAASEQFAVVCAQEGRIQIGIAVHPLSQPRIAIDEPSRGRYIGIASVAFESQRFVAVLFAQHLKLYEFGDRLLEIRSTLDLDKVPFAIEPFEQRLLVAFQEKVELYQPEVVSASDVRLRKISEMITQGSACCVTCDEDMVAVADELQSVVLYNFNDSTNKFGENARNTFDLGVRLCCMHGDDYFAIDNSGNFYQMAIGETKNLESYDLIVLACCNLGHRATAMIILPTKVPRLLIATESGQYIEVISFLPPPGFENLYAAIENQVQSLGRLNSRMYRTVMLGHYLFPAPVMPTLDLLKMFMQLDESSQTTIVNTIRFSLEDAKAICTQVLANA
jgi:hypothetical protein